MIYLRLLPYVLLTFLFYSSPLASQVTNFYNWQVKDGLPQNTINSIIQSKDGYLWMATEGGLVRFDGISFKTFDTNNTPELKSNRIRFLFQNTNGDIFISGYRIGLCIYSKGKFKNISSEIGIENSVVRKIYSDYMNRLWVSTFDSGTVVINASTYELFEEFKDLRSVSAAHIQFKDNEFILSIYEKNYKWNNGLRHIDMPTGYFNASYLGRFAFDYARNWIWVLSDKSLLKMYQGKLIQEYPLPEVKTQEKDDYKLIITDSTLIISCINQSTLTVFDLITERFYPNVIQFDCNIGQVNAIYTDQEGNKWYGTSNCGLIKEKPSRFSYIDEGKDFVNRNFTSVYLGSNNRMYFGTLSNGYAELDIKTGLLFKSGSTDVSTFNVYSIQEYKGQIFFGLGDKNFVLVKDGQSEKRLYYPGNIYPMTRSVYATSSGQLYFGTDRGVFYLESGKILQHNKLTEITRGQINGLFEDSRQNLWIINDFDIYKYSEKTEKLLLSHRGDSLAPRYYRGISEDKDGRMYIGSYGYGLTVIEGPMKYTININNGLYENVVSSVIEDKNGFLWLTGNKGLTRIFKKELIEILKGRRKRLNATLFNDQTDKLRTPEFNGGGQNSAHKLAEGVYAFSTINGCLRIDFNTFRLNTLPPPVHIEYITFGDSLYSRQNSISLPYSEERLDIKFTALSFTDPMNVTFKYKLEGYDKDWINGGTDRRTTYNKLPPGQYVFKVIACNNDGVWNMEGDSMEITIVPTVYMTWWFRSMIGFSGMGIVFVVFLFYQKQKRKQELEKSAMMDLLPDLLLRMDKKGNYIDIYGNPTLLILPFGNKESRSIRDVFTPELSELLLAKIDLAFKEKRLQLFDYALNLSDGELHYFEGRVLAIDQNEVLLIVRDITEATQAQNKIKENEQALLKAAENEKKLLESITIQQKQQLEAIINTEEKERRRIAIDLHDGIGQLLTIVKLNMDLAKETLRDNSTTKAKELVISTENTIEQIIHEIRSISYNLLPPSLERFGLATAIEEELLKLNKHFNPKAIFYSSCRDKKYHAQTEIILFRAFQEIINNALKHASATEISVQLIEHEDKLILMIEDNGKGYNLTESIHKKNSSGLKNLFSRISSVQGSINIDSNSSSGTSVIITVSI